MIRLALALLVLLAPPAHAGAWPRDEGETFLSFSIETEFENGLTDGSDAYGSLYAEHGLADGFTIGLDAGGDRDDVYKVIGFLRWPVSVAPLPGVWSIEFGLGAVDDRIALRPGVSYGRGLSVGQTPGWFAVDTRAFFSDGFDGVIETDITVGLKPRPDHMVIVQLQTGAPSQSAAYAKIAPSYVFEMTPGHHLEIGMIAGVMEADDVKLKIGLWHKF